MVAPCNESDSEIEKCGIFPLGFCLRYTKCILLKSYFLAIFKIERNCHSVKGDFKMNDATSIFCIFEM